MSGWIKFEKDLLTDPRVLRIAKVLERRWITFDTSAKYYSDPSDSSNAAALPAVTLVCGALVRIWSLADTHIGPDNVLPLGIDELDEVVGIPGFCASLPADWLIPVDEHSVELPEYHAHNGTEAKKRAVTQKRVSRFRAQALQGSNGRALPDQDQDKDQTPSTPKPRVAQKHTATSGFDRFWQAYPKKASKGQAEKVWQKLSPDEQLTEQILQAVERAKTRADWQKQEGQFIPYPATWLNAKGWEDSPKIELPKLALQVAV